MHDAGRRAFNRQVQDQVLHRVAGRPLGPRLVLPRCNTSTRCPSQPSGFVFGGMDKVPSEFTKAAVVLPATWQIRIFLLEWERAPDASREILHLA